jgi:transmembrane sensor
MNNGEKITDKEWEKLGVSFSEGDVNVDAAWDKLHSRISKLPITNEYRKPRIRIINSTLFRIAAIGLILLSLGVAAVYVGNNRLFSKTIIATTGNDQKNLIVELPDGSRIYLNRNTELSYRSDFGKTSRDVSLKGEAFFEIKPDASKPFIIDAGKANVKVVGTSFNVITSNCKSEVEVFVKTGKVLLSDDSGDKSVLLDPGFIGKSDSKSVKKSLNENANYLSWNTGLLVYKGEKLDIVFKDLKRVYNMDIVADDPAILENPWNSPIDNETQDTIIRLICASFNLSYSIDGNIYHLSEK